MIADICITPANFSTCFKQKIDEDCLQEYMSYACKVSELASKHMQSLPLCVNSFSSYYSYNFNGNTVDRDNRTAEDLTNIEFASVVKIRGYEAAQWYRTYYNAYCEANKSSDTEPLSYAEYMGSYLLSKMYGYIRMMLQYASKCSDAFISVEQKESYDKTVKRAILFIYALIAYVELCPDAVQEQFIKAIKRDYKVCASGRASYGTPFIVLKKDRVKYWERDFKVRANR